MKDELNELTQKNIKRLNRYIINKRCNARRDKIDFALTAQQAITLIIESGHAHNIGRTRDSYQLCRKNHNEGYTLKNVFIGSAAENTLERIQRCGLPTGGGPPRKYDGKTERQRRAQAARAYRARRKTASA